MLDCIVTIIHGSVASAFDQWCTPLLTMSGSTLLCWLQDMLYQWSMLINTDQCRIKFNVLIAMSINKYQCRSMTINIDQYFSMLLNANQCRSMLIDASLISIGYHCISGGIDQHWEALRSIDQYWSSLIFIDQHCDQYMKFDPALIGIDRHWALIQHVLWLVHGTNMCHQIVFTPQSHTNLLKDQCQIMLYSLEKHLTI